MKPVEVHFDYASPFSYLAMELVPRVLEDAALTWRPVYLRGLETFSKGVPYGAPKMQYLARDLTRCAAHEGIELNPPAMFPLDGIHALRGAIVAQERNVFARYHRSMFRAAWAEQRDISDKAVVADILGEATGEPATAMLEAIADQRVKDRLRANTASAVERGVFGLPAFFVGDEMFWGHDRIDYVARAAKE